MAQVGNTYRGQPIRIYLHGKWSFSFSMQINLLAQCAPGRTLEPAPQVGAAEKPQPLLCGPLHIPVLRARLECGVPRGTTTSWGDNSFRKQPAKCQGLPPSLTCGNPPPPKLSHQAPLGTRLFVHFFSLLTISYRISAKV